MYKVLMLAVVTLSLTLGCANKAKDHTCSADYTKASCVDPATKAATPHTCPPDCTKACCVDPAAKTDTPHTCPPDCTKACCTAKTE